MRLLLDTNALIWAVLRPWQLSQRALDAISDGDNAVFMSVVNAWEVAIKASLGKLVVPDDIEARIRRGCSSTPGSASYPLSSATPSRSASCRCTTRIRSTACWLPRPGSKV